MLHTCLKKKECAQNGALLLNKYIRLFSQQSNHESPTNKRENMKTRIAILALACAGFAHAGFAQETVKTESGRVVILNANGTWQYSTALLDEREQSQKNKRSPNATTKFDMGKTGCSLFYDAAKWKKTSEEQGRTTFQHKNNDGYAMVLFERIFIPMDNISDLALQNAQKASSNVKVIAQDSRTVNGTKVIAAQMSGTLKGIPFTYLNYYFSVRGGTVQIFTYTGTNIFLEYKTDFEEFLNGVSTCE